jgi:hypothetical protein
LAVATPFVRVKGITIESQLIEVKVAVPVVELLEVVSFFLHPIKVAIVKRITENKIVFFILICF